MFAHFTTSIELWFLDLFIRLLSHPGVVYFWRARLNSSSFPRLIFFYSLVFSVFGVMGFLSGYVVVVLQLFR